MRVCVCVRFDAVCVYLWLDLDVVFVFVFFDVFSIYSCFEMYFNIFISCLKMDFEKLSSLVFLPPYHHLHPNPIISYPKTHFKKISPPFFLPALIRAPPSFSLLRLSLSSNHSLHLYTLTSIFPPSLHIITFTLTQLFHTQKRTLKKYLHHFSTNVYVFCSLFPAYERSRIRKKIESGTSGEGSWAA